MKKMQLFCSVMLYYFKKGKNIIETQKKIDAVYGEGSAKMSVSRQVRIHSQAA